MGSPLLPVEIDMLLWLVVGRVKLGSDKTLCLVLKIHGEGYCESLWLSHH